MLTTLLMSLTTAVTPVETPAIADVLAENNNEVIQTMENRRKNTRKLGFANSMENRRKNTRKLSFSSEMENRRKNTRKL